MPLRRPRSPTPSGNTRPVLGDSRGMESTVFEGEGEVADLVGRLEVDRPELSRIDADRLAIH